MSSIGPIAAPTMRRHLVSDLGSHIMHRTPMCCLRLLGRLLVVLLASCYPNVRGGTTCMAACRAGQTNHYCCLGCMSKVITCVSTPSHTHGHTRAHTHRQHTSRHIQVAHTRRTHTYTIDRYRQPHARRAALSRNTLDTHSQ